LILFEVLENMQKRILAKFDGPQLQKMQPNFPPTFATYNIYMAFTIVKKIYWKVGGKLSEWNWNWSIAPCRNKFLQILLNKIGYLATEGLCKLHFLM